MVKYWFISAQTQLQLFLFQKLYLHILISYYLSIWSVFCQSISKVKYNCGRINIVKLPCPKYEPWNCTMSHNKSNIRLLHLLLLTGLHTHRNSKQLACRPTKVNYWFLSFPIWKKCVIVLQSQYGKILIFRKKNWEEEERPVGSV